MFARALGIGNCYKSELIFWQKAKILNFTWEFFGFNLHEQTRYSNLKSVHN